jgi:hypothetical protein
VSRHRRQGRESPKRRRSEPRHNRRRANIRAQFLKWIRRLSIALRAFWKLILAACALLGATALFYFWPVLDIDPAYQDADPLRVSYLLTNNGFLDIYPDAVFCFVREIKFRSNRRLPLTGSQGGVWLRYDLDKDAVLKGRGDKAEARPLFVPFDIGTDSVASGNVIVLVRYRMYWLGWERKRERRVSFTIETKPDGNLRWSRRFLRTEDRELEPESGAVLYFAPKSG